jgi:hypothetical protein
VGTACWREVTLGGDSGPGVTPTLQPSAKQAWRGHEGHWMCGDFGWWL